MRHLFSTAVSIIALSLATPALAQEVHLLDAMEDASPWQATASTDVKAAASSVPGHQGRAIRLDYDFDGRAGYAVLSRSLAIDLPDNYEISFWVKGAGPTNTFELKLTDAAAENVWWKQTTRYDAPNGWTQVVIKRRQVSKAWGPSPETILQRAERIEFVMVAADGGRGHIEIDQITLRPLPVDPLVPPAPTASDDQPGTTAPRAVDLDPKTAWTTPHLNPAALTLDLGYEREFGGVRLDWADHSAASHYRLMASSDGQTWHPLAEVEGGNGGTDWLRTPEASARWLRLDLTQPLPRTDRLVRAPQYALREITLQPLAFGQDATSFVEVVAKQELRGLYPRGFFGEQPYWTLVGVDGGGESGLIGEDGAIELRRGGPSIEPFVIDNGRLISWADAAITQGLKDQDLPLPFVVWTKDDWQLKISSLAEGTPDQARLWGRYELTNTSNRPRSLTLALMARPYQVNGPVQFLAIPGGVAPVETLTWEAGQLSLDATQVRPLSAPDSVAMARFDQGADPQSLILPAVRRHANQTQSLSDATGLPAAALMYEVTLQPGETRQFGFVSPLSGAPITTASLPDFDRAEQALSQQWRATLDRVDLILPPSAQPIEDALKSSLAHMLMSRQGPILQPGTRSYNRSWIRDGAMMAEGLNRLGHTAHSADYLRWYAPYVFDNGKVPCCVDARGADPVPENDSHGQFVFLAAETYRYGGDKALLMQVWPQVQKAMAYMDELRASTRTAQFQTPDKAHLYGLLPPTISHEGYSDKPAYSYWDDFWGLTGYRDAVFIAKTLGDEASASHYQQGYDQFAADIRATLIATAKHHDIDWIAGAADRGDFDATSTTMALSPAGLEGGEGAGDLPPELLNRTFDIYWQNFQERLTNQKAWKDYTPYEWRLVSALVRLGQKDRALQVLDFLMADRRPVAWNGWAEVVGHHMREPRFIGDMPHAWISSDFIRSALDLLAYERTSSQSLVLAAGVPQDWLDNEQGVGVRGLRTAHGPLTYHYVRKGSGYQLDIAPGANPPGGFVLQWPADQTRPSRVLIDGRPAAWAGDELAIPSGTRQVILR